jgi:alkylated DNA repair dioxygenase AlkB
MGCVNSVFQPSLLDGGSTVTFSATGTGSERTPLAGGAWVELRRNWVGGSDQLFHRLLDCVPWRAERRRMFDRVLDVPRLVAYYGEDDPLPDREVELIRSALNREYSPELGEPFATSGLCLYRDGCDSVAWHGDRIGRSRTEDTMVAIVSLGTPRRFLLRPRGGGTSSAFALGRGDLLVMGGSCQRTWEHSVPKHAGASGPRISLQFRPRGVR